ncbi:MAG TPA: hypothetical protein VI999_04000 [Thermoplasmata archaeon]|nr:hypothetical protein [Thermoplasmata archaeon]
MWTIATLEKIDQRLHHLRRVEASYRAAIRRAQQAMRQNTADPVKAKKKFEKFRAKYERKIDRLQPKVKQLTHERAELKG